jgi:spore coat polysaccharide biosynthesis predicted glycosyltransferase SpsG
VAAAGASAGRGHLGRALAVAEALVANGLRADLVLRAGELSPSQADRVRVLGIGDDPGRDPAATIVDLPDPNESVGERADRLVVFDDAERFEGAAAIVIQPSLPAWHPPGGARAGHVLAGFDYAPIARAVRERAAARGPEGQLPYLLVCFGGSDPDDVTGRMVPALLGLPGTGAIVVVGADYRGAIPTGVTDEQLDVRRDPADFIDLLAGAALVVASAGTLKFELAVLGRPMILLAVADDQLATGPAFAATGAARFAGDGRTLAPGVVHAAAAQLLADPTARTALGSRARLVTDGRGGDRIARAVSGLVGTG